MFEKTKITELEKMVRESLTTSKSSIMEATKILRYLQKSSRYRENEKYKKEPFKVYLEDRFAVRYGTYHEWTRALPFEKEASVYGVGLVSKTLKRCGAVGTTQVFKEIVNLETKPKGGITRAIIERIIEKYQDPKHMAAIKRETNDWKAMYLETNQKLTEAYKRIRELEEQNREKDEQIEKLIITASLVPQIRKIVEARPVMQQ